MPDKPMNSDRRCDGTFAPGNPGGHGRPRRAVEVEFLAALADCVSLERWRAIVSRAVQDAVAGDGTARAWLSKHLIATRENQLLLLAADEAESGGLEAAVASWITNIHNRARDIHNFLEAQRAGPLAGMEHELMKAARLCAELDEESA